MSSITGPGLFRSALLFESGANILSITQLLFVPDTFLSFLVTGPNQITPATTTLARWFGGVFVLATAPLLLSYSNDGPREVVTARRRFTYQIMGISEVALGCVFAGNYVAGGSGMTDTALLTATAMMGLFGGMRAFFLFVKPEWMEPEASGKKGQ